MAQGSRCQGSRKAWTSAEFALAVGACTAFDVRDLEWLGDMQSPAGRSAAGEGKAQGRQEVREMRRAPGSRQADCQEHIEAGALRLRADREWLRASLPMFSSILLAPAAERSRCMAENVAGAEEN